MCIIGTRQVTGIDANELEVAKSREGQAGSWLQSLLDCEHGTPRRAPIGKRLVGDALCQGRRENVPAGRSKTVPLNATL